jgi:hypothetical protein
MSTPESTIATGRGRKKSGAFSRTVKYFDENFDIQSTTVSGEISLAANMAEASALLGGDETKIVDAINDYAKTAEIARKVEEAQGQGLDEKAVMKFLRPFREVPPYSEESSPAEQTKMLLARVKDSPFMLEAIRAASGITSDDEN